MANLSRFTNNTTSNLRPPLGGGGGLLLKQQQRRHYYSRFKCKWILLYGIFGFLILYLFSLLYSFWFLVTFMDETSSISNTNNLFSIPQQQQQQQLLHQEYPKDEEDQPDWILQNWQKHVQKLQTNWLLEQQQKQQQNDHSSIIIPNIAITAFLEPPLNATIPGTGNRSSPAGVGTPPEYYTPLPLRTHSPNELRKITYKTINSCRNIPAFLPIDRGLQLDPNNTKQSIPWNIGDDPTPTNFIEKEIQHCPVDADPFLPWIHDVFWDINSNKVQFIAQNKRRCKTGLGFGEDLERLEPQVALLQSVPIEIITQEKVQKLAPELWQSSSSSSSTMKNENARRRYRLAPYDEADFNATRFICKFHTWSIISSSSSLPSPQHSTTTKSYRHHRRRIDLGETLSEYPFNYELADYRKNPHRLGLLSRQGKDNGKFWTSTLMFSCPIPKGITPIKQQQQQIMAAAAPPVLFVDIIPIRTPPRYPISNLDGKQQQRRRQDDAGYYLHPDWVGPPNVGRFDPNKAWGTRHALPEIEASGRWENIPVCPLEDEQDDEKGWAAKKDELSSSSGDTAAAKDSNNIGLHKKQKKPHLLSACLWAAASFRTRGTIKKLTSDTKVRLKEWIEFHLMVGFDHIYVYDNSAAHTNETNLSDVTDLYPSQRVTRIDWPSIVCNNNIPAHDNTGERSSQYSAENSCRVRYRHKTEFIAVFDTDEYLVPMGNHSTLRTVVENAKHTQILSFRSTRGKLRYSASEPAERNGRRMRSNVTFLEAYNCDSAKAPKPEHGDRARKQLFRADYVLNHFVHYSTVTQAYMTQYKDDPKGWSRMDVHHGPPVERVVDEINEATMVHTKEIDLGQTANYRKRCNVGFKKKWLGCYIGYPWPDGIELEGLNQTDGTQYNCFVNEKVENYFLPRLREAMKKTKT